MASKISQHSDLVIVGSEPAAAVAALRGRALGLSAVLVRDEAARKPAATAAWLAGPGIEMCGQCGLAADDIEMTAFEGISLHSGDFRRHLHVAADGVAGWMVERGAFEQALRKRAVDEGARVIKGSVRSIDLGDDELKLSLSDGNVLRGAILIVADGPESPTAGLARMSSLDRAHKIPQWFNLTVASAADKGELSVVLGVGHGTNIGTISRLPGKLHLGLLIRGGDGSPQSQFDEFRAAAEAANLIPVSPRAKPVVVPSPAGVALDMDSHVGKRTLLIGEAGGFVAAFNNDPLYAAMRSGWLAAETAARAIAADLVQDELVTFESAWRTELADYLRMPSTDLSLLMPLVFNENLQMSQRVARAFLLGDKF